MKRMLPHRNNPPERKWVFGECRGRARYAGAKAGIFGEVTGISTRRTCGLWTTAREQSTASKAGKDSVPARTTRDEPGGPYNCRCRKLGRGAEFDGSGRSTEDLVGMRTAGEERTRGRAMRGSWVTDQDIGLGIASIPLRLETLRMSEPMRCGLGHRRVPLSQSRSTDSGRSGRLKPYWGKPAVRNFIGPAAIGRFCSRRLTPLSPKTPSHHRGRADH